ncbi:MAG: VOC family protein [Polyangiaceae bacterium]
MIQAYLNFPGTLAEAFAFYAKVFGGKVESIMPFGESPMKDQVPAGWHGKALHGTMTIGSSQILGSDAPPDRYKKPQGFSVSITLGVEEAKSAFAALSEGGSVEMPLTKTFWAEGFGMLTDKYGIPWMITGGHGPK